ncbi:MAG: hypothetical protein RO257_12795 [Candidatus Kapabacteria bacterium]|jgi:hypothetical protein|nr:hypothetical protein [Candidatus Kapabacteria bacterium]
MSNEILYLNDISGAVTAVQIPIANWENLQNEMKRYRQMFNLKNDLSEAFKQVELLSSWKLKKQSMKEFLSELNVIPTDKFKSQSKKLKLR